MFYNKNSYTKIFIGGKFYDINEKNEVIKETKKMYYALDIKSSKIVFHSMSVKVIKNWVNTYYPEAIITKEI